MNSVPPETVDMFVQTCRRAAGFGLMRCSSGNFSMRVDGGLLLVKASRSWMSDVCPDDVSVCRVDDGSLVEGRKPSVEIGFHSGVLRERPDVNIVMHFQTPYATALACQDRSDINYFVIPEIPFYVGPVARILYLPPGSGELAGAVMEALRGHDLVVMGNHGQVTVARDADHAIQNAVFFELASEIIVHAGEKVVPIPEAEAQKLIEASRSARAGV
jgi:ribulose-5-phosphate 4-epimerase/fuculose-1-phosphate aldolase